MSANVCEDVDNLLDIIFTDMRAGWQHHEVPKDRLGDGQVRADSGIFNSSVVEWSVIRSCKYVLGLQEAQRIIARQGPCIANTDYYEPIIRALRFLMFYNFQSVYISQAGNIQA